MSAEKILHPLQEHFRKVLKKLMAEFELSGGVQHRGDKGTARETFLNTFLEGAFPKKYVIHRGEIFDGEGTIARQADIVVYDESFPAFAFGAGNRYMAEGVLAHIEVKSKLTKAELLDSIVKAMSVKKLKLQVEPDMHVGPMRKHIPSFIFAYQSGWEDVAGFRKAYLDLQSEHDGFEATPDGIFILGPGYGCDIGESGIQFFNSGEDILGVSFVRLQQAIHKNWSGRVKWDGYASELIIDNV